MNRLLSCYLLDPADQENGALDIELEILLLTEQMKARDMEPYRLALSNSLNAAVATAVMAYTVLGQHRP